MNDLAQASGGVSTALLKAVGSDLMAVFKLAEETGSMNRARHCANRINRRSFDHRDTSCPGCPTVLSLIIS